MPVGDDMSPASFAQQLRDRTKANVTVVPSSTAISHSAPLDFVRAPPSATLYSQATASGSASLASSSILPLPLSAIKPEPLDPVLDAAAVSKPPSSSSSVPTLTPQPTLTPTSQVNTPLLSTLRRLTQENSRTSPPTLIPRIPPKYYPGNTTSPMVSILPKKTSPGKPTDFTMTKTIMGDAPSEFANVVTSSVVTTVKSADVTESSKRKSTSKYATSNLAARKATAGVTKSIVTTTAKLTTTDTSMDATTSKKHVTLLKKHSEQTRDNSTTALPSTDVKKKKRKGKKKGKKRKLISHSGGDPQEKAMRHIVDNSSTTSEKQLTPSHSSHADEQDKRPEERLHSAKSRPGRTESNLPATTETEVTRPRQKTKRQRSETSETSRSSTEDLPATAVMRPSVSKHVPQASESSEPGTSATSIVDSSERGTGGGDKLGASDRIRRLREKLKQQQLAVEEARKQKEQTDKFIQSLDY